MVFLLVVLQITKNTFLILFFVKLPNFYHFLKEGNFPFSSFLWDEMKIPLMAGKVHSIVDRNIYDYGETYACNLRNCFFFGIDVGRRLNFHMNYLCECVWNGIQMNIAITRAREGKSGIFFFLF